MTNLKKTLKNRLDRAEKIALLGIGSELNGDDAAGMLVAERLKKSFRTRRTRPFFKVFFGGTAPENITGEIKRFKPSHLIMVDAADIGQKAGGMILIEPQDVSGVSFSTHRLPTKIIAEYLSRCLDCRIVIIGIQPKSVEFGKRPSPQMRRAVERFSGLMLDLLGGHI